jgi:thiol-disulfide isomerase/thioredoxin
MKRFIVFLLLCFVSAPIWADNQTCLSYLQVGASSCDQQVSGTIVSEGGILPAPTVAEEDVMEVERSPEPQPKEITLDDRIDEYMDSYGKPPREFVAFNLEPTLENALKWAKKYKDLTERNQKLTAAWGQAQTILSEMEGKGLEVSGYEPMPEIPDYGVGVSGGFAAFADNLPSQQNDYDGIAAKSNARQGAPSIGFSENDSSLGITSRKDSSAVNTGKNDLYGESLTPPPKEDKGVVEVSYYFSAECPYCARFEESFKGLVQELDHQIKVTCVDMTPSKRTKANIHGKIDCSWRAAIPGEAKALGVMSTPTLIVDRKIGQGLEKVEGLVDMGKLKAFLKGEV